MSEVIVYSTRICPYCVRAKQLLNNKAVEFKEILIDENPEERTRMMELTKRRTVPQIIINGESIGGFDELYALEQAGKLDDLLKQEKKNG